MHDQPKWEERWQTIAVTPSGAEIRRLVYLHPWYRTYTAQYRCGRYVIEHDFYTADLDAIAIEAFIDREKQAEIDALAEDGRTFAWIG